MFGCFAAFADQTYGQQTETHSPPPVLNGREVDPTSNGMLILTKFISCG